MSTGRVFERVVIGGARVVDVDVSGDQDRWQLRKPAADESTRITTSDIRADGQLMPNNRHRGHPLRAFRETHPSLQRTILLLIVAGVVIAFALHRLMH
jgi:hypothetical protein